MIMIFRGIYMKIPYVFKKCTKCGRWLVANKVNFHNQKGAKYNLASQCKECRNNQKRQYRKYNKEKVAKSNKQYYQDNKRKILGQKKQYYETNKEKVREQQKQYYEANKEKIAESTKRYREANKHEERERNKRYYEANKEKVLERCKRYLQTPQGQVVEFNRHQRRRAKEEQLGSGITKEQWLEMMNFFEWKCAYSGEHLGGDDNSFNRTIDHIIPISKNGPNMVWNCVPMTRSLNSSKNNKNMLEWYEQQEYFSEERLAKIREWQEYAFNKYNKEEK